jgi:guanylate kinase
VAKREIGYKGKYDYVVVNDSLGTAYKKLKKIIQAESKGR